MKLQTTGAVARCGRQGAALVLVLAVACCVYAPGLSGGFVFDDWNNLVFNERLIAASNWNLRQIWYAMASSDSGPLKRPVAMLSFTLNHIVSGMDPAAFKLTNIVIHCLTGLGVYVLFAQTLACSSVALFEKRESVHWAALFGAGVWLLHPLQLTSVLYIVQRMASLATLFMVWGMVAYALGRNRQLRCRDGRRGIAAAYLLFLPLAALSKENGLLLPAFLFLIELTVFRFQGLSRGGLRMLAGWHIVMAVLPIVVVSVYLLVDPAWLLKSYAHRDFTLLERLLTESRVLWFHLGQWFFPAPGRFALYHDDFTVSLGLWSPITTVVAVTAWGAVAMVAISAVFRSPAFSFPVLFFLLGHALESSFFGLELVHEHRNYLPMVGVAWGMSSVALWMWNRFEVRRYVIVSSAMLLLGLAGLTAMRADLWGDDIERALVQASYHEFSPRSQTDAGEILLRMAQTQGYPRELLASARKYFRRASELESYTLSGEFGELLAIHYLGEATPPRLLNGMVGRLGRPPLAAVTPESVVRLIQCQHRGECRFPPEEILQIVQAIGGNPQLRSVDQARIVAEMVQWSMNERQMNDALEYALQAVALQPMHAQHRLNLAAVLISMGSFSRAVETLGEARNVDRDGFYANRIEALERVLVERRASGISGM